MLFEKYKLNPQNTTINQIMQKESMLLNNRVTKCNAMCKYSIFKPQKRHHVIIHVRWLGILLWWH